MKRTLSLIIVTILFISTVSFAQEGRPQYKIRNERAGVYIGDIIIELFPYVAPLHVANFDSLVSISFYDSTAWHRVVPDFVIQGGDPNSINGPRETWGYGDSSQATVPAEFSKVSHLTGIIGAARDEDINSANSQFYINSADNTGLDGNYTAYGIVVEGMDVVYDIEGSASDANDNPLEKIEMFITKLGVNESIPGIPTLVGPENKTTAFTGDSTLVWAPVESAVLYFVEIARDSLFNDIAIADSFAVKQGNLSVKIEDIELGEKKFFWRVRANNGAKFGDYSDIRSFITSIVPPTLTTPSDSSIGVPINPLLQWESVDGAISYRVQLVRNFANFAEARLIINETGITETELQIEGLDPNQKYCWHVACETADYVGPYSEVSYFTTGEATAVEDEENVPTEFVLFQNYPNPFNPTTSIKFQIPEWVSGNVTLSIFDVLGRKIESLVNENLQKGIYEIEFDASNLTSGIYYYKLESGNYTNTRKMILLK